MDENKTVLRVLCFDDYSHLYDWGYLSVSIFQCVVLNISLIYIYILNWKYHWSEGSSLLFWHGVWKRGISQTSKRGKTFFKLNLRSKYIISKQNCITLQPKNITSVVYLLSLSQSRTGRIDSEKISMTEGRGDQPTAAAVTLLSIKLYKYHYDFKWCL